MKKESYHFESKTLSEATFYIGKRNNVSHQELGVWLDVERERNGPARGEWR